MTESPRGVRRPGLRAPGGDSRRAAVLRSQRSGPSLTSGSMGGVARIYASTKSAVESITEPLNAELTPLGIRAIVIEHGAYRTDFMDPSSLAAAPAKPSPTMSLCIGSWIHSDAEITSSPAPPTRLLPRF